MAYALPFLLLFLLLALILRVDFFVTILWFVLGVFVLARFWTRWVARRVEVERLYTDRAFTGDSVTVRLLVRNTGLLPLPWLEMSESVPLDLREEPFPTQVFSLSSHGRKDFAYQLYCRRRGYYRLGPMRFSTGDLLGVDERVLHAEEPRALVVYPRIVPLDRLGLPTSSALVTRPARTPLFEDPSRVLGVRAYVPGDSPRRIHWSASARTGELVVKQYQPAIAREMLICLDLDPHGYEDFRWREAIENAIVVAASLANHAITREGQPAGLAAIGRDPLIDSEASFTLAPGGERGHLIALLEVLARIQPSSSHQFVDLLRGQGARLRWGSTVVVITGRLSEDLAHTVLYLKRSGRAVALILVQPEHLREAVAPGVPTYHLWTDRDLAALA